MALTYLNLDALKTEISCHNLPANSQDAEAITQQLGLRYPRIDCLCIIQDSHEDWEAESRKMGGVHGGALVAIAASASLRSESGILTRRDNSDSQR